MAEQISIGLLMRLSSEQRLALLEARLHDRLRENPREVLIAVFAKKKRILSKTG